MPRVITSLFALILSLSVFCSCSTMDKNTDTAEGTFALAQEYEKSDRFEEAIRYYQDVKNKFPYSKLAIQSELAVANVQFKQESYPEAQASYQLFKEMHPKHSQIDYVIYKLGLSYYNQLPETVDRDLSLATQAISTFDELIKMYSDSSYLNETKEKRKECLTKLAGHEDYIGYFYFKRGKYEAALGRYENLLSKYPHVGYDEVAIVRAAFSAARTQKIEKAKNYLNKLKSEFPNSHEIANIQKELGL